MLGAVTDTAGVLTLNWTHGFLAPARFFGFAWDIYLGKFLDAGLNGSIFYDFPTAANTGAIPLGLSGGYHAWISAQYPDGSLHIATNPWTGIMYSGVPHVPVVNQVQILNGPARQVRLDWQTDVFGTWHYQIIAFKVTNLSPFEGNFVTSDGPSGNPSLFHLVDFGESVFTPGTASFFDGHADLTLPMDGNYVLFIRGVPWLAPNTPGAYGVSLLFEVGP